MSQKKTIWFEVMENESIEECLQRISEAGYHVIGKKEEPLFQEVNGEITPIRQIIKFKGNLISD